MATVAEIATWRSGPLREASADLKMTARRYAEVAEGLGGFVNDEVFVGEAGDAEAASRRALVDDMGDMQRILEKAANDFDAIADAIDELVPEAEGIRIELGGAQVPDVGGAGIPDGVYWRATTCMSKGDAIVRALENVYAELGGLVAAGEAPSAGIMSHGVSAPKKGWSVEEVNDWWTSLSREEQETIITSHPEWIGNLNGIPIDDRSDANVNRLDGEIEAVTAELEKAEEEWEASRVMTVPEMGPMVQRAPDLVALQDKKRQLEALKQAFAEDDGDHKLVSLDVWSSDRLRAVVAIGDVDRADRVMVHTPGMTSTVSSSLVTFSGEWGGGVEGVQNVLNEAKWQLDGQGRGDELAGVVFLGYDAPQWDEMVSSNSVALSKSAREGGENLAGLLESIQATHEGDLYLVASGHSYGSTVTGYALRQSTVADEVMVMGSPGITTRQNQDVNMVPGHVSVGEAQGFPRIPFVDVGDGDPVADLGRFGGDPSTSREFNTIGTDEWTSPEGVEYTDSKGHSEYYDAGRTSVYDQASVLIGNGVVAGVEQ
ncbi:alpha/beta hydrolase [Actinobaculum sp. 313]|uniref:alpha/beta hydrolase n=1 Tax=Actinobaculum sp. 313 TaxID=2495645 RepID=UPI000D529E3D|nr:alpha/beta hydrolase [Actinobaculum sp. 313]AWE42982.1 hypothetical protein DDD63_09800 [Actinobaculum sp. 313]